MAITFTLSNSGGMSGGATIAGSRTETGNTQLSYDLNYPAASTDVALAATITAANVQAIILKSDKNLTIEANSASSPAFVINLKAGSPLVWSKSDAYAANPFTANVTGFFITCVEAARLQGSILVA